MALFVPRLHERQTLDEQHRKDARHQVENESAEKGESGGLQEAWAGRWLRGAWQSGRGASRTGGVSGASRAFGVRGACRIRFGSGCSGLAGGSSLCDQFVRAAARELKQAGKFFRICSERVVLLQIQREAAGGGRYRLRRGIGKDVGIRRKERCFGFAMTRND